MNENSTERETVYVEGYGLIYTDTGEAADQGEPLVEAGAEFTEREVEWALKKLFRIESELQARKARLKAEVEAIKANYTPTVNRLERARESFLQWTRPQLRRFAERVLEARNTKADGTQKANPERSLKYPHGALAFRAVNEVRVAAPEGGVEAVADAVRWVGAAYPNALEYVPRLNLAGLTLGQLEQIRAVEAGEMTWQEAGWPGPCPLKVTLPGETFDVKSGVKL